MKNPPLHRYATRPGLYFTDDGGADVVVRSETADQVWLCVLEPIDEPSAFFQDAIRLFEDPNISFIQQIHEFPVCTRIIEHLYLRETLFRMTGPNYGLWYVHLPKAWDGMRYGYRVDGAWDPKHGVRFNPYKFLLDPYGKGIDGSMELTPAAFSYECDVVDRKVIGSAYGAMSTVDSLGHMPVSVAIDDRDTHKHEGDPQHPHVPWRKTVIYEMHVKGFTANAPWLPEALRGTYAGLAHPTTLAYLQGLGITSIELLPIMAKQDELFLQEHGRKNYWGYSTLSYFAPEPSYATKAAQEKGAAAVRQEVWCARCTRPASKSSWTWSTTTHAKAASKARRSAGAASTTWPTIAIKNPIPVDSKTPPVAAIRWTSPTRMWSPLPSTHYDTGPSVSA